MKATIILDHDKECTIVSSELNISDGFLKFKDATMDDCRQEEEVWIPTSLVKCLVWKDKPWQAKEKKE